MKRYGALVCAGDFTNPGWGWATEISPAGGLGSVAAFIMVAERLWPRDVVGKGPQPLGMMPVMSIAYPRSPSGAPSRIAPDLCREWGIADIRIADGLDRQAAQA